MKPKFWTILSLIVILSTMAACVPPTAAPAPAQPAAAEPTKAPEAAAPVESWWATAAKAAGCVGKTIKGVSESTPPSKFAADPIAKEFTKETGINVEFETTSWDQMYDKAIKDMEANTGIYDFVYIEQDIVYAYMARNFLVNITQMLKDKPELAFKDFNVDQFVTFVNYFKDKKTGDLYGMPMEAFIKTYLYRTDLFDDAEAKAAFEKKYGYPLAPATDHKQYSDIAEFFTQWGKDKSLDLWGTTVQATTGHPASWYEGFTEVPPQFGVYDWGINMDNWKACVANGGTMNSDKNKAALTWWLSLLPYAPPESTSSTWDEVAATFAAGRAAQGLVYGENAAWIATDPTRSKVVGKVGVALPPLEPGVLDAVKAGTGSVGYYDGGAFGIPHSSKNKECSLLWLQYFAQEKFQADWAAASARITHKSTYDDPKVKDMDAKTNGYFTLMKDQGYLYAGASPFPFHASLREAILPFFLKAITGELTPEAALDQMCATAETELAKLGYK